MITRLLASHNTVPIIVGVAVKGTGTDQCSSHLLLKRRLGDVGGGCEHMARYVGKMWDYLKLPPFLQLSLSFSLDVDSAFHSVVLAQSYLRFRLI
jgi:hypothetical protein